ncbi:MAG TPA: universal stress protein [Bryobacteraceae bacterium]|nr:universal stress protein [Bryobacteraceae bacterium]
MLPFRSILFPVDYSDASKALAPWVAQMANQFNTSLTLLHAYSPDFLAYADLAPQFVELSAYSRQFEENRLREFARASFPGRPVDTIATLGDPAAVIESVMEHQGADLIMLPTHGRGPARRLLLGSVTTKVLHHVSAAVWTAANTVLSATPASPPQSILSIVDDTGESEVILRAAAALAAEFRARLRLATVVLLPQPSRGLDFEQYYQMLRSAATERLRELKGRLNIDVPFSVLEGPVSREVHDEAVRHKADLIVAGRGSSQDTFAAFSSGLYDVIREAPCPVLSI